MNIRFSLLASAFVSILAIQSIPALADHGKNFHCDGIPFMSGVDKEKMDSIAHNNGMRQIIQFLATNWENAEIKRLCKAAADGQEIDQSCLDNRRDWDAIIATIPEGLAGKSNKELRPIMLEIGQRGYHTTDRKAALSYCANLGVIDDVFK